MPKLITPTIWSGYQTATLTHQTRVVASGGTINLLRDLDNKIQTQNNELGLSSNLLLAFGASSGYKKTATLVDNVYDWSGNNMDLTGTTVSRPTYNPTGRMNKASFDFSGSSTTDQSRFKTASYSFTNPNNQITVMGWFSMLAAGNVGTVHTLFRTGTITGSGTALWIYRNFNSSSFTFRYLDSAFVDRLATITIAGGTTGGFDGWYHLAFTFDYTTKVFNIYRNGSLAGTTTTAGLVPVFPTINDVKEFGYHSTLNSYGYAGSMDDMRVYNKVLTPDQIQRIMLEI